MQIFLLIGSCSVELFLEVHIVLEILVVRIRVIEDLGVRVGAKHLRLRMNARVHSCLGHREVVRVARNGCRSSLVGLADSDQRTVPFGCLHCRNSGHYGL